MASNRHLGRIIALQTLYEQDFRRSSHDLDFDLQAVLKRNIARYEATVDDTSFIEVLVQGVTDTEAELNTRLQPLAKERPMAEIARMDRVILQIGAFELTHDNGVPPKVVINEAVELAKAFGSENSSRFVNGVLGSLLRQLNGDTSTETDDQVVADAKEETASEPAASAVPAENPQETTEKDNA